MARGFGVRKYYELYEYDKKIAEGTLVSISEQTGIKKKTLENYIRQAARGRRLFDVGTESQVYSFYKGDENVAEGSIRQIAKQLNIKTDLVRWYLNPSAQKRSGHALITLEGETVIEKRNATKYAPVLTDLKYEPVAKKKQYVNKPVKLKEFKFDNKWINYQLAGLFRGWD